MSGHGASSDTALRLADRMRSEAPWELFAERIRRYEVHWNGRRIEMIRGPIVLEGYAVRLFRSRDSKTGVGFQASTDLSDEGLRTATADAEGLTQYSEFPTKKVELPSSAPHSTTSVDIRDPGLWDRPAEYLGEYVETLFRAFDGKRDVAPSFGSVRATLSETSLANSFGLRTAHADTSIDFEIAVKAFGGPEGPPPGEYWVNDTTRKLEPSQLPEEVEQWCRYARDVRQATQPPTGDLPVLLPASVSSGILPMVMGFQFTGFARLRKIAPDLGRTVGVEGLSVHDDGRVPWAIGSSPVDDEGTPQRRRTLIAKGAVSELMYDALHAGAFDVPRTGNAVRGMEFGFRDWKRFLHRPQGTATTLVIDPGPGGTDVELIEAAGDGVWVQQLGWAMPDTISTAFGGELRIGYRIRHGKLAEPVRGGTVGGVVLSPPGAPSMLASIAAIGSTPTLTNGVQMPTLLIRPLTVAGSGG
ncbi:MAG: TldD/PmbA family protein [Thermoplasmata archaeon]